MNTQLQHREHVCNTIRSTHQRLGLQRVHRPRFCPSVSAPQPQTCSRSCMTMRWMALSSNWKRQASGSRAAAPLASVAAGASASTSAPRQQQQGQQEPSPEQESLELLEWPAVCRQVACFCGTSMAAEQLLAGQLPMGGSQKESEMLLAQTAEAMEAELTVSGVYDLRPALDAAASGACLSAKQLEGVASSMEAAFAAAQAANAPNRAGSGPAYPLLAVLAAGVRAEERGTLAALRQCISAGAVTDSASPSLAQVRLERQENLAALRALVTGIARDLAQKGGSESREPVIVRGRFCVAVRATHRSLLPKGSVRLGASGTGATLYVEPAPAVDLNNNEALYADQEASEESAVLLALSRLLAGRSQALRGMLASVAALDVAAARAKHAEWLGAVRPRFVSRYEVDSPSPLSIPGARHPLLMAPALPRPPNPPSSEDNSFTRNFAPPPSWATPSSSSGSDGSSSSSSREPELPKALDLRVPHGTAVVAITGPNTGGKTVTLKTAGLMALMAKAGLYLPADTEELLAAGVEQPSLHWFNAVLADIGDAQSLQQSLSTFSGHVRRIRRILGAAGRLSLVLLDEVGSGTDPMEGAALARAVLDRLAGQAGLTLATTHHAELKAAAEQDPRYTNVSMAFDIKTLSPTYTLAWGAAGASNAIAIARALGFDAAVLRDATAIVAEVETEAERKSQMVAVADTVSREIEEVEDLIEAKRRARAIKEGEISRLRGLVSELGAFRRALRSAPRRLERENAARVMQLQRAMQRARRGDEGLEGVEEVFGVLERLAPARVAELKGRPMAGGEFRAGDNVYVPKMGALGHGSVTKVRGNQLTVTMGAMGLMGMGKSSSGMLELRVRADEVVKVLPADPAPWEAGGQDGAALMERVDSALQATGSKSDS